MDNFTTVIDLFFIGAHSTCIKNPLHRVSGAQNIHIFNDTTILYYKFGANAISANTNAIC